MTPENPDRIFVGEVDEYWEFEDRNTLPLRDPNVPLPEAIIPRLVVPDEESDGEQNPAK